MTDHKKIRGIPKTREHNEKNRKAHLGVKNSQISVAQTGVKNHQWKDDVGYHSLHAWVKRWKGKPNLCDMCKIIGKFNGRKWSIHWANKSGEYKRDLEDWVGLCAKCHHQYDKKNHGTIRGRQKKNKSE